MTVGRETMCTRPRCKAVPFNIEQSVSALLDDSDVNLFCYCEGIIHFDPEIAHRAFDFGVSKEQLDCSQVTGSLVY